MFTGTLKSVHMLVFKNNSPHIFGLPLGAFKPPHNAVAAVLDGRGWKRGGSDKRGGREEHGAAEHTSDAEFKADRTTETPP